MSTSPPSGLRRLIEAAGEALRLDPLRTVRPIDRHNVYRIFGSLDDPVARRRRVALDSAAARYVIPVWEEMWHDDGDPSSPCALLSRAERVLDGEPFDPRIYTEALETCDLTGFVINMVDRDIVAQERAADATRAAITTLRTASGQDPFIALRIDESTRDSEIDEEDADAARWAALAMSAGIEGIDIRACREFWEWWLWEAVPSAWGATSALRTVVEYLGNPEQLAILKGGAEVWNAWRKEHPREGVNLSGAELCGVQLRGAQLQCSNLRKTDLTKADLISANLFQADLTGADLPEAVLRAALLEEADLTGADLRRADLSRARLSRAKIFGANLSGSILRSTQLERAILGHTVLRRADLGHSHLDGTDLSAANLFGADLSGAHLRGANLRGAVLGQAVLSHADLKSADLSGADLSEAVLVGTDLCGADLTGCRVYGMAAWDVLHNKETKQDNLVITPGDEPQITIDSLEVAQFVYLLLRNEKIRDVMNTLGKRAVLILGRFSEPRKQILDALREALRHKGYLPIVFDFERPTDRDFSETIRTLVGLCLFVIADITNPRSSPLELQAIVPDYMLPFVPILQEGEEPFAMFRDLQTKYDWVTAVIEYDSAENLIAALEPAVITPALAVHDRMLERKTRKLHSRNIREILSTEVR